MIREYARTNAAHNTLIVKQIVLNTTKAIILITVLFTQAKGGELDT